MGKFLVRLFAVIGAVMTVSMILGAVSTWYWLSHPAPAPQAPATMVLDLDFTKPIVEQSRAMPLTLTSFLGEEEGETSLLSLIRALDAAKKDSRVKGVVARFGSRQPSFAHAQEIRAALQRFRESGKFTYAYAPNYGDFGQGNRTYYLASAFENIWLQPVGTVGLTGLGMEAPFGKTALGNLGVTGDFLRREDYKSVMENVTRDEFSAPVRANMESMLKNLAEQQLKGIADSRGFALEKARDLAADGPFTANEALKNGLVTRIGYEDEMLEIALLRGTDAPDKKGRDGARPTRVDVESYLAFQPAGEEPKAVVALIEGLGMITDAAPSGPSPLSEDRVINTQKLVEAFDAAAKDDEVKAILFRVDSPGGSPSASETIRHALIKAKEAHKPVFVSMGGVAASGGYWISMNADHIVAEPGTITGSIGVVAGKFVLGGLWQKLGVKWENLTTSENARLWSSQRPFAPRDRDRVNAMLDETYNAFISNVAAARKIPLEKMPDIAKGRVWTGEQAVKVGLVDELGGMETSFQAIKKHLKLDPKDPLALQPFPPPETPADFVLKLLKGFGVESAMMRETLASLHGLQTALAPMLEGVSDTGAVKARLPAEVVGVVR